MVAKQIALLSISFDETAGDQFLSAFSAVCVIALLKVIDSAPSLGVYYFLSSTLSVCHKLQIESSFLFLDGIKPFLHDPLYKTLFFDFSFRLPNAQNLLPKIWHKID